MHLILLLMRVKNSKKILNERKGVFAWTYDDMPGIDRTIAEHRIPTDPAKRPVKQKLRRLRLEWAS